MRPTILKTFCFAVCCLIGATAFAQELDLPIVVKQLADHESRLDVIEAKLGIGQPTKAEPLPAPSILNAKSTIRTRSHWTFPGSSIYEHLKNEHGVDATLLSDEAAKSLHDDLHEGRTVSSTVMRSAPLGGTVTKQRTVEAVQSSCPGGRCPTTTNRSYSRTSSGWYLGKNLGL